MYVPEGCSYLMLTPVCVNLVAHSFYSQRQLQESRLVLKGHRYEINFEELEQLLSKPEVKMLEFMNPHSTTGRVWSCAELEQLVEIIEKTGKVLLVNEIYADLSLKPFQSLLKYADRLKDQLIVCGSPSKAFNVSGSVCGYGIMPNVADANRFKEIEL